MLQLHGALPGEIAIWAVEGAVMDEFGEALTPPVAAAVDRVAGEVLEYLDAPAVSSLKGAA